MSPAENVDAFLNRYEVAFTEAFRRVLTGTIPADTAYGLVWFQHDDTVPLLPLTLVWCDGKHGCDAPQPPPLAVETDEPWESPSSFDDATLGKLMFQWVRRCWQAAGGAESSVPLYAYNYHTGEHFSFQHGCYVQQSDLVLAKD